MFSQITGDMMTKPFLMRCTILTLAYNRGADPWNEACSAVGTCKRVTKGQRRDSRRSASVGVNDGHHREPDLSVILIC
jgi:hypothetical protein